MIMPRDRDQSRQIPGVDRNYRASGEHIQQSAVAWCFALTDDGSPAMTASELASLAKRLGMKSVEMVPPESFGTIRAAGLDCALAPIDMSPDPPFVKGFNNPAYQTQVIEATRESIDACAAFGFPAVIAFTGYNAVDVDDPASGLISRDEGLTHCVHGLKKIVGYAEEKGVALMLEMLNSRDASHPMKGHPGYQGDDLEYCVEVIKRVGSPNLKLLFDIYHVQIMHGDVIRRIEELQEFIGHYHTAGVPGRGELDDQQELNYGAIMRAIVATGYDGYVGQEFIPTWGDKVASLAHAVKVCDV